MAERVDCSYLACQQIARREAGNFYYAFWMLPAAKRRAMCALYAFLRHTDDLADNPLSADQRREDLAAWRASLERALNGDFDSAILPALVDTVQRFSIPTEYLFSAIDGVEMDLTPRRFETFDDLARYCHLVASVVGLACIHIWGFRGPQALEPACQCGIAFQLTNILRDLREDARSGRIYLPQEDLTRFGYTPDDLLQGVVDDRFDRLLEFEIDRARQHYRAAEALRTWLEPDGLAAFGVMTDIYRGVLDEIARAPAAIMERRVGLSVWRKLGITARWFLPWPLVRHQTTSSGAASG